MKKSEYEIGDVVSLNEEEKMLLENKVNEADAARQAFKHAAYWMQEIEKRMFKLVERMRPSLANVEYTISHEDPEIIISDTERKNDSIR